MDDRKIRILTLITIIKQLYKAQSSRLSKQKKIYNVRVLIQDERLIKELNLNIEQIDRMIINIVNYNNEIKKMKKIRNKTPKLRKKKVVKINNIIKDKVSLKKLVSNLNEKDNEYNRNVLRNFIDYKLDNGSEKELDQIYNIYFKSIVDNNISLLNVIVDANIDVNAQDGKGNTGLHYALYYSRINVMMILLQNDADKNIRNNDNNIPKDLINKNLIYDNKGANKDDMLNLLNYRKNKTFKMNTSVSLFGKHDNLININNEKDLNKIKNHKGILIFYMIKCGWCKKMQGDIKMLCARGTKVYVMESNQISYIVKKEYEINGYPTIYVLKSGKIEKYNGERSYKSFEKQLK